MKKTTKISLVLSITMILMSVCVLVGTTFAWFTDSASTGVNKIQAGNLDMTVEHSSDFVSWAEVDEATPIFDENAKWEPGYVEVQYLKVANVGSLAFKFQVSLAVASEVAGTNKAGESFKLSDVLQYQVVEVTKEYATREEAKAALTAPLKLAGNVKLQEEVLQAGAAAKTYAVIVYMPEVVGNEANYQTGTVAPEVNFGIVIDATQAAVEVDSFDEKYDDAASFLVAQGFDFESGSHTLTTGIKAAQPGSIAVRASGASTEVVIESGEFDGGANGNNICVFASKGATVTIKGGSYTVGCDADGLGNSVVYTSGGHVVIEGGFFQTDYKYNGLYYVLNQYNSNPGTITVTGGTFVNYNPANGDDNLGGNFVAAGYKVVTEVHGTDTWYIVVPE